MSQVWFAGAHSNVGGGYPKQGMSFVALDWMLEEASQAGRPFGQHGLRLNRSEREWFREHASVDDKLYDPRAGLGVFYRWRIRDIKAICEAHGVRPRIHVSVLERIAHGTDDYSPGNLPADADVVFTPPPNSANTELAQRRAAGVQRVLATIPGGSLLNRVKRETAFGELSYYIYLVACLLFLAGAWRAAAVRLLRNLRPGGRVSAALGLAPFTNPWETTARIAQAGLDAAVAASGARGRVRDRLRAHAVRGQPHELGVLGLLVREAGGVARRAEAGAGRRPGSHGGTRPTPSGDASAVARIA